MENLEKTKPHLIAKAFSSHPQTPDRIEATQKEIATLLPPRAEYVVTTSEFDDVKARLARIENKRKLNDGGKGNQPTLRRASSSTTTTPTHRRTPRAARATIGQPCSAATTTNRRDTTLGRGAEGRESEEPLPQLSPGSFDTHIPL